MSNIELKAYTIWNRRGSLFSLILVTCDVPDGRKKYFITDRAVVCFPCDYTPLNAEEVEAKMDGQSGMPNFGPTMDLWAAITTLLVHPDHPPNVNTTAFFDRQVLTHPIETHDEKMWDPRMHCGKLVIWTIEDRTIVYFRSGLSHLHFLHPVPRVSYPQSTCNPSHMLAQDFCNGSREMALFYALHADERPKVANIVHCLERMNKTPSTALVTPVGMYVVTHLAYPRWIDLWKRFDATTQATFDAFLQ